MGVCQTRFRDKGKVRKLSTYSTMELESIKTRLSNNKLFMDSFWAVFGNGLGNALLLIAGILIARFLGKDLYGEYGVVKTTMFYIASFATFGLGFTSTKYIAQYVTEGNKYIRSIIRDSLLITVCFSGVIAFFLILFAEPLANYVNEPDLKVAFQALAIIIIFKAVTTTQIGLLSGLKIFDKAARNSVITGVVMLCSCVPLTYFWALQGSLVSLALSQAINALLNHITINNHEKKIKNQINRSFVYELLVFSFPVALQESSFTICNWAAVLFLTKFSSAGELGLYTAAAQWNAIITMVPCLLTNVVLSHLSGTISAKEQHDIILKRMLIVNLVCTFVPFIIVYIIANYIASFYGSSFSDLPSVIRVLTLVTIFEACASVYKSELMALGKTWALFIIRFFRDAILVGGVYVYLVYNNGMNGALWYSVISDISSILFLIIIFSYYKHLSKS